MALNIYRRSTQSPPVGWFRDVDIGVLLCFCVCACVFFTLPFFYQLNKQSRDQPLSVSLLFFSFEFLLSTVHMFCTGCVSRKKHRSVKRIKTFFPLESPRFRSFRYHLRLLRCFCYQICSLFFFYWPFSLGELRCCFTVGGEESALC